MTDLSSLHVLITGASSGIGRATAELLAQRRARLILVARREDRLSEIKEQCLKLGAGSVICKSFDVTQVDKISSTFESLQPDVLINNAGLALGKAPFEECSYSDMDQMLNTNVRGLLHLTKFFLPSIKSSSNGHIVNISSVAGHWTYPSGHVYNATKYAVHGFSEALRLDLAGTRVRVTEIAPGRVETEFSDVRFKGDKTKAKAEYEGYEALTAQDIAECIVWSLERPARVNIQEIIVFPQAQSSVTQISKR